MKKQHTGIDKSEMDKTVKNQQEKSETFASKIPFIPLSVDFDLNRASKKTQSKCNEVVGGETALEEKEQHALYLYHKRWGTFDTVMFFLLEYVLQVEATTQKSVSVNFSEAYRVLRTMIIAVQNNPKKKHADEFTLHFKGRSETDTFSATFPIADEDYVDSYRDYIMAAVAAPRILAETSIQQIVNAWEQLLGRLLGLKYNFEPSLMPSNISVSMTDILRVGTFEDVKDLFENKVVKEFLRNNTDEQLNVLKKELGISFVDMFKSNVLKELKEIVLRRHAIVHCDSIATDDYCKEVNHLGIPEPQRGKRLVTNVPYAIHAWDIVYAAGTIIAHMACLKHARKLKSKMLEKFANGRLVSTSFGALKHSRSDAACIILEYANKLKIQTEWEMLAIKINLAIAYKGQGKTKEMNAVLDEYNWEYAPKEFKVAALALKGENKKALSELFKWCGKDLERIKCAHEWIVFEDLRKDPEFEKRMAKLRVKGNRELIKITAPSVNTNGDETTRIERLNALFEAAVKYAHKD